MDEVVAEAERLVVLPLPALHANLIEEVLHLVAPPVPMFIMH